MAGDKGGSKEAKYANGMLGIVEIEFLRDSYSTRYSKLLRESERMSPKFTLMRFASNSGET